MRYIQHLALAVAALLLTIQPARAEVLKINGTEFAPAYQVGDVELRARGVALLRWAMVFDVYAGAFYMPEDLRSERWNDDVAKHLELSYLRDIPASGFVESSEKHLRSTLPPEEYNRISPRLQQLYPLFRDIGAGDRYGLTYKPGVGTTLSLNGEPLGTIPGADFAVAYFGIWLGDKPLQEKFRDRILGDEQS